jgi:hypothetical protein
MRWMEIGGKRIAIFLSVYKDAIGIAVTYMSSPLIHQRGCINEHVMRRYLDLAIGEAKCSTNSSRIWVFFFFLTLATAAATLPSSVAIDSIIIRGVVNGRRVGVKKCVTESALLVSLGTGRILSVSSARPSFAGTSFHGRCGRGGFPAIDVVEVRCLHKMRND